MGKQTNLMNIILVVSLIVAVAFSEKKIFRPFSELEDLPFSVRLLRTPDGGCEIFQTGHTNRHRGLAKSLVVIEATPDHTHEHEHDGYAHAHTHDAHDPDSNATLSMEYISFESSAIWERIESECGKIRTAPKPSTNDDDDEVREIWISGDSSNRVDIIVVGDGYLESQRENFFSDIKRLFDETIDDPGMDFWLPVINVFAVFRASNDEGITIGGQQRDTAYSLSRSSAGQFRGIGISASGASAAQASARAASLTWNFVSAIANDDHYGGAVSRGIIIGTRSEYSGVQVWRHELGHSLASVGEEYDGGGYSGPNTASTITEARSKWGLWFSDPNRVTMEEGEMLVQAYQWQDVYEQPASVSFTSRGWPRWQLIISTMGFDDDDILVVELDGQHLDVFPSFGNIDRHFQSYVSQTTLGAGSHTLRFWSRIPSAGEVPRMLCSVNLYEYQSEPAFHLDDDSWHGLYPTNGGGRIRPTSNYCTMRYVFGPQFCYACRQSIWSRFMDRMGLIDAVEVETIGDFVVVLVVLPLVGQLRADPIPDEYYTVKWYYEGVEQTQFENQFEWSTPDVVSGSWEVLVDFFQPHVRTSTGEPANSDHFQFNI